MISCSRETDSVPEPHRRRDVDYAALTATVRRRAMELGFQQVAITDADLGSDEAALLAWLDAGYHGELEYMARHGVRRARPAALVPGTIRIVSVRMDYLRGGADAETVLANPELGYVSRYALGPRLPQVDPAPPPAPRRPYRIRDRRLRLPCLRRQRPGHGEAACAQRRTRMDRQAHESHQPERRFLVLSRRALHRSSP